jgi:hypothetical protein
MYAFCCCRLCVFNYMMMGMDIGRGVHGGVAMFLRGTRMMSTGTVSVHQMRAIVRSDAPQRLGHRAAHNSY